MEQDITFQFLGMQKKVAELWYGQSVVGGSAGSGTVGCPCGCRMADGAHSLDGKCL